jgi:hypothetical protein
LRYWEGTDWSDRFRARPPIPVPGASGSVGAPTPGGFAPGWSANTAGIDQTQLVEQVRLAARQEAERAAAEFARQARSVTGELEPLISQYTSAFGRLVRRAAVIVVVVAVVWVAWQVFVQASLLDWIGDRIDGLGDR